MSKPVLETGVSARRQDAPAGLGPEDRCEGGARRAARIRASVSHPRPARPRQAAAAPRGDRIRASVSHPWPARPRQAAAARRGERIRASASHPWPARPRQAAAAPRGDRIHASASHRWPARPRQPGGHWPAWLRALLLAVVLSLAAGTGAPAAPADLTQIIYDDALASGWENWSWAQVNLANTAPVHSGTYSIAVTYGAWQGLYLHNSNVTAQGFTYLRFFIDGGTAGGQRMNLFLNLQVSGQDQDGPNVAVTPPAAGSWTEVRVPLATLNPAGATITGITWQDSTGGTQPTFYLDDIGFLAVQAAAAPQLSAGSVSPRSLPADGATQFVARVHVVDPLGPANVAAVQLEGLPAGPVEMHDDGLSDDGAAGDGTYGAALALPTGTPTGELQLSILAQNQQGYTATLPLGTLAVLAPPGGQVPAPLPQRIGWGSDAWSETAGQDWQVNSGVPWDYVYQYITYEWYSDGWGGNFVGRFVDQAWSKGYIPVVSVYMMLDLPPTCGEGGACYATKLQNASAVQTYLAALTEAASEANGTKPVIFHLEPDFYGFMQLLSLTAPPAGVKPNDPTSFPVALNITGYPNTLAGFGRRLVDLIHTTAPNALVAPMASAWATDQDPQTASAADAITMGQQTAAFISAMGGAQADLFFVEWSNADAGSGLSAWWDDTDGTLPRPTRALLWENAVSAAAGKRLILWQVPVGNMSLDNTCDHYRDNRAAYLFSHPRDLVDAGVTGVLFGGGLPCMTEVTTDGGFVGAQGAIAYAAPAAPAGLSASMLGGLAATVRWDESSEPDLWGYRVLYRPLAGGTARVVDARRQDALGLVLPAPGAWALSVEAYDAMGRESAPSSPVTVTATTAPHSAYLPALRR
jgi:hypothetical protein